jgi:hypothetical protein
MPHAFDTGATVAQRTRVRNAVIAKLAPLLKTADPQRYLHAVKPLAEMYEKGGQHGEALLLEALNGAQPAIAVALGRMPFDTGGMDPASLTGDLPIGVYCVSQNQRGTVEGRLAADVVATTDVTADPGVETILEHALELLAGQRLPDPTVEPDEDGVLTLLSGVQELRAEFEDLHVFKDITIGELRFTVQVTREINRGRDVTQVATEVENKVFADSIEDADPESDDDLAPLVTTLTEIPAPEED